MKGSPVGPMTTRVTGGIAVLRKTLRFRPWLRSSTRARLGDGSQKMMVRDENVHVSETKSYKTFERSEIHRD